MDIQSKSSVNPNNIPSSLKPWPNWVCWKEMIRKGEPTKPPVDVRTGKLASSDDSNTWNTFDNALVYYHAHSNNGIRGIGFELGEPKSTPYVGIDLDNCRNPETGEIKPWAKKIIDRVNSYTEISPSGEGIRIFAIAILPEGGRKKGDVEMYDGNRFLTVTGNHLEGTPLIIECRHDEVEALHKKVFGEKKTEQKEQPHSQSSSSIDDDELLKRIFNSKNGAKFKKLHEGNISDYPSQSEAELAYCNTLAFWTNKDRERIDRIFRLSKLFRAKWDEKHGAKTYGEMTIDKAIEATQNTYKEPQPKQAKTIKQSVTLAFPDIMTGAAGAFARAYAAISESPIQFYYLAWLTCLGSYLSGKITLNTLLDVQTRLYMLFLGPSGRGRKSTPITITTQFFKEALEDFSLMYQCNSGEGLAVYLEKHPWTILVYDEFLAFVSKAIQKGNTLLGTVSTLFEKNTYQTATKDKQLVIENAHLSMLGACTTDTWERCWERDFTAIGLNNRLFLAYGTMETFVSIPPRLDIEIWKSLRDELRDVIRHALYVKEFTLTPGAYTRYDDWYKNKIDHKSLHSVRLDQYALRFMLLLTINELKTVIDEEIVDKVIKLVEWEHLIRQQFDPIDADNESAKAEIKIRRILSTGPLGLRKLQQRTNAQRMGLWIWKAALGNLQTNEEVFFDSETKLFMIGEAD